MPRNDDYDDDDRPRRRRPRDDEDEVAPRRRRPRDDYDDEPLRRAPKKKSSLPLILGILGGVFLLCCGGGGFALYWFGDTVVGEARDVQVSTNNLRQIGLAAHAFHDDKGFLPNNSHSPDGRPLLSWRVHLLPYLGQQALYNRFKLTEPWDSVNNRPLVAEMPAVYGTPKLNKSTTPGSTYYRGFAHQGAIFQKPIRPGAPQRLTMTGITDGTSNTILALEAGDAVEWTRPDDLDFGPGKPLPRLGSDRKGDVVLTLMLSGETRLLPKRYSETTWRGLTSYNGGEVVSFD